MIVIISRLQERVRYLEKLVQYKKQSLVDAPCGRIKSKTKGDHVYYDYLIEGGDGKQVRRYLHADDDDDLSLARRVAQRGYDEKVLARAEKELAILKKAVAFYEKEKAEDVYETLSEARRRLVAPIRLTDEQYVAKWKAKKYRRKKIKEGAPVFETKRCDLVRSKSEVFIADELYDRGIPYRYEYPVQVTDHVTNEIHTVHPDFMVLHIKARKAYFWEHFGRMDDPGYASDNVAKLIDYERSGIILART